MNYSLNLFIQLILISQWIYYSLSQLNYCLKSIGCQHDECCYNIVPKTGPVCDPIPGCAAYFRPECCRNARPLHTDYGIMYGYAISLDNEYGYQENARRYVQIWKGVPYARPPTRENNLRFRRPVPPTLSTQKYDATYFRPACSQPSLSSQSSFMEWSKYPHEWVKRFSFQQTDEEVSNISEDCLYLNVYNLKEVDTSITSNFNDNQKRYPIIVFLDGVDHLAGSANRYPGHALAQLGLVVFTVNYRLGPFGYLATKIPSLQEGNDEDNDDMLLGNYGLWDQIRALEFIKENADKFFGDPNQITLIGHGSAAADVALHLLSEKSGRRSPPLFHRAVLMSGSDQMEGGFVQSVEESEAYAKQFAYQVGCDVTSSKRSMIDCLRSRTAIELSNAASQTRIHRPNWLTKPWAPTLDYDFIQDTPNYLWNNGLYTHIPVIGGLAVDDGAFHALASIYQLGTTSNWHLINKTKGVHTNSQLPDPNTEFSGMSIDLMRAGFMEMVKRDFALDPVGMTNSLCFHYTYWPDKTNPITRWEMYRSSWTDRFVGSGIVQTLRYHSNPKFTKKEIDPVSNQLLSMNRTQMYVFGYKSVNDLWTRIVGVFHGSELQYMFGLPLLLLYRSEEEVREEWPSDLGLKPPRYEYTEMDVKMAGYMLSFISNFAKSANATPQPIRNLTWDTYRIENRTYLWLNLTQNKTLYESGRLDLEARRIDTGFDLRQNYKLSKYAYWNHVYRKQLLWLPRFAAPAPLLVDLENYRLASFILAGILFITCIIIMSLLIVYCRRRKMLTS